MALEPINYGAAANDGTGDSLREAMRKSQANFEYLDQGKVDKVAGMGLSSNNFTNAERVKLSNIGDGASNDRSKHIGTQPLSTITGAGTAAAMNVLGAGGIIERGSNANGEYVRFADGTQFCTASIKGYAAGIVSVPLPASFVGATACFVSITPSDDWAKEDAIYSSGTQWVVKMAVASANNSMQLFACGRYK